MKFDSEFKDAISMLPPKEKDKLILRLLKRDLILAQKLYFELLSGESVLDRRLKMEERVKNEITRLSKSSYRLKALMDIRYLSGEITEHVKVTNDKYGEASLNLLMLIELLKKNNNRIAQAKVKDSYTLNIYIIARAFKILILIKSLHEDYLIEFENGLMELGKLISSNPTIMDIAIRNGFDVNWLIKADIPDDIATIHKDVRENGFLK